MAHALQVAAFEQQDAKRVVKNAATAAGQALNKDNAAKRAFDRPKAIWAENPTTNIHREAVKAAEALLAEVNSKVAAKNTCTRNLPSS